MSDKKKQKKTETIIGPKFKLIKIPQGIFRDIYGRPDIVANRMLWVNDAAKCVIDRIKNSQYNGRIVITDITRKPSESYIARQKKGRHVAQCGLSGHNYGISIDIALEETAKALGVHLNALNPILEGLGLKNIRSEAWHYNMGFTVARDYFYNLYANSSETFKNHFKESFIEKFNLVVGMNLKSVKVIQAFLDITVDGALGRQSFCAASMLMAERLGMFDTSNKEKTEIIIDFGKIWS